MGADFSHLSVVVVDYSTYSRQITVSALRSFGIVDIAYARDAQSGFKTIYHTFPDLVIADWDLCRDDGIKLLEWVRTRRDSPDRTLPFIFLSAHTAESRVALARDKGVSEFLAKPFSPPKLLSRIMGILETPRPFVQTPRFFGPDRRRYRRSELLGEERRKTTKNLNI